VPEVDDLIRLRAMRPEDAAAVAALIRTAFAAQSVPTDPPPSALRITEADVAEHLRAGGGAVAEVAGGLAGTALWAEQDDGLYLGRLARGAGVAWPRDREPWWRRPRRRARWACHASI
jgi:hypothetical protein